MPGDIALDSTMAIRYLNGDPAVVAKIAVLPRVVLPLAVVGELLFGAENSARPLENLCRYFRFIDVCTAMPMRRDFGKSGPVKGSDRGVSVNPRGS